MEYKSRLLEEIVLAYFQAYKIVLLLGARQVGKSTLLKHLFPKLQMIVFDPLQDLYGARRDPDLFINSFPSPLILDELQYVPELLPSLKRKVDLSDDKGQYLITGSQNLAILKRASESLAGRVGILHLSGMSYGEFHSFPPWVPDYLNQPKEFVRKTSGRQILEENLPLHLWRGSMPGTMTLPDQLIPGYYRSYIQTYIERDVRQVENIREMMEFDRFLSLLGSLTGQELNMSQLGREIGISPPTSRKWLDILQNTYQWIEIPPYHGNTIKRISGKHKGYLCDTGLACYLQRIPNPEALLSYPFLGSIFESWVVNEINKQFATMMLTPIVYHWRTSGGAEVDMILDWNGVLYPIEIKCKTHVTKNDLKGMKSFRETYPNAQIAPGLVIYAGNTARFLDENTLALPWNFRLFS